MIRPRDLSSNLEKENPNGIELTEDMAEKGMNSISNPMAAEEFLVKVVEDMAEKGMNSMGIYIATFLIAVTLLSSMIMGMFTSGLLP